MQDFGEMFSKEPKNYGEISSKNYRHKNRKIVILTPSNPFAIKILEKSIYLILSVTHLAIWAAIKEPKFAALLPIN